MKKLILPIAIVGLLAFAGTASAAPQGSGTVTITPNVEQCSVRVVITWTGDVDNAGHQVNVDNVGVQDTARQLDNKGDQLTKTWASSPGQKPGVFIYDFVLADGVPHAIEVIAHAFGQRKHEFAQMDCSNPVPPQIVTVDRPVEVVREVPVERVVTRTVVKRGRCIVKGRLPNGKRRFVCPRPKSRKVRGKRHDGRQNVTARPNDAG